MLRGRRTGRRRRFALAIAMLNVLALACALVACSSGGDSPSASPTAATSVPVAAASPSPAPTSAVAGEIAALLHVDADLPAGLTVQQNQHRTLHSGDTPGLTTDAEGVFITLATAANNEFVTEIAVVVDSGSAQSMLDAYTVGNYLAGFTGGATDATGQEAQAGAGAPVGAKAISYSGTAPGPNGSPQRVEGQSVAFITGRVFVVLIHATYAPPLPALDLGALAGTIAGRLTNASGLD